MNEKLIRLDEINFHSVAMALLKNLWVVLLLCLSASMCLSSYAKLVYEPKFTSSATFMVGARDSTNAYNSLTTTQSMASVFAEVFQSNVLRDKIQEQLGEETFVGAISTHTVPETNLVIVSVTAKSPEQAFRSLNLIVENYSSISDYIFANAQLEVIKDPVIPTVPSNPLNTSKNRSVVLLITAIITVGVIIAITAMRDTVQTPRAARRKVDARLLRTIHHEQRNKTMRSKFTRKNIAPLVTSPLISKQFIEDNMNLCSAVEYHMRKRGQKVILITSAGENEGKSTVTANLALSLAGKGKRVLLLDCDFRKPSLHKILETPLGNQPVFSDYLQQTQEDPQPYLSYLKKHRITTGFSRSEHKSIAAMINSGKLNAMIQGLRDKMDYIILDTPPMLAAADAEAIARLADTALLVVRGDFMQTAAINDCLDNLRKSAPDLTGIVLNNYHRSLFQ